MLSKLLDRARSLLRGGPLGLRGRQTLRLECLSAPAEVVFDGAGVPYLYAASQRDLLALQGYLHAHDRLFQLEMMRRLARGELSAAVGRQPIRTRDWTVHFKDISTVEFDLFWRSFQLEQAAKRSLAQATPEFRALAGAMAEGVNERLRRGRWQRPLEAQLLGLEIEPWTELDPFIVYKGFAASLALVWHAKLTLAALLRVHPDKAEALSALMALPGQVDETKLRSTAAPVRTLRLAAIGRAALEVTGYTAGGYGSNAWVVAGKHTKSGKPLMACDPHLPLMAPCIGYLQHLEAPGIKAAGYAGPGVPGLVMGHNEDYAFAITHAWIDDCDLFREEIDADGQRCRTPEGWSELESQTLRVDVRGQDAVERVVRYGPHGPLLTDVLGGVAGRLDDASSAKRSDGLGGSAEEGLALRWTGQDGGRDLEAYWGVAKGRCWGDFRQACGLFAAPAWNMLYADRDGHIGYQLAGWIPDRPWQGSLGVVDGSKTNDWSGYVSYEELPSSFDPEEGVVASGNQRIVGDEYPHYLSDLFEPPFRAERARAVLLRGGHDLDSLRALQLDDHSGWALRITRERLLPLFDELQHPDARLALLLLRAWDGRMDKDAVAPAVYYSFVLAFVRRTLVLRLGSALAEAVLERFTMPALAIEKMLARDEDAWFGTSALTGDAQAGSALLEAALAEGVGELRRRLGPKSSGWRWGRLHRRTQQHALGDLPVIGRFFNVGPREASGDGTTLNTGILRFSEPYDMFGGSDARLLVDLSRLDASRWVSATGQSGDPLSPHFRDQFELLVTGRDRPWPFSRAAVEAEGTHRVHLEPGSRPDRPRG